MSRLRDLAIGHRIDLDYLSNYEYDILVMLINEANDVLVETIVRRLATGTGAKTTQHMQQILSELRGLNHELFARIYNDIEGRYIDIASYEVDWQERSIGSILPVSFSRPAVNNLLAAALHDGPVGMTLAGGISSLAASHFDRFSRAVSVGVAAGLSTSDIVSSLYGTRSANGSNGVFELTRARARTVVNTSIANISSVARERFFYSNRDIVKSVKMLATLDSRTTELCRWIDQKVFDVGVGPRPPFHYNCRTTAVPVLFSWEELGIVVNDVPDSYRPSLDGLVPSDISYYDWAKKYGHPLNEYYTPPARIKKSLKQLTDGH